ncbi:hypothetical protein RF11_13072 [Thelohanellus kitauei]|uniref:Uncharacterized protein n=1 Tax=Thelohanellus kitauei TaxID=669202 RepID=A0A0C2MRI6_THEKT|nr:hypothetical protein RF11_13072 [Thelohanellus kitauei]
MIDIYHALQESASNEITLNVTAPVDNGELDNLPDPTPSCLRGSHLSALSTLTNLTTSAAKNVSVNQSWTQHVAPNASPSSCWPIRHNPSSEELGIMQSILKTSPGAYSVPKTTFGHNQCQYGSISHKPARGKQATRLTKSEKAFIQEPSPKCAVISARTLAQVQEIEITQHGVFSPSPSSYTPQRVEIRVLEVSPPAVTVGDPPLLPVQCKKKRHAGALNKPNELVYQLYNDTLLSPVDEAELCTDLSAISATNGAINMANMLLHVDRSCHDKLGKTDQIIYRELASSGPETFATIRSEPDYLGSEESNTSVTRYGRCRRLSRGQSEGGRSLLRNQDSVQKTTTFLQNTSERQSRSRTSRGSPGSRRTSTAGPQEFARTSRVKTKGSARAPGRRRCDTSAHIILGHSEQATEETTPSVTIARANLVLVDSPIID